MKTRRQLAPQTVSRARGLLATHYPSMCAPVSYTQHSVGEAHAAVEQGSAAGKVVIDIEPGVAGVAPSR